MEANRVPILQKQCSALQVKNDRISAEIEQMRLNYYKDLQVFKVHDHQRRKEENQQHGIHLSVNYFDTLHGLP